MLASTSFIYKPAVVAYLYTVAATATAAITLQRYYDYHVQNRQDEDAALMQRSHCTIPSQRDLAARIQGAELSGFSKSMLGGLRCASQEMIEPRLTQLLM